jgi:hypothetical protein
MFVGTGLWVPVYVYRAYPPLYCITRHKTLVEGEQLPAAKAQGCYLQPP